MTCVATVPYRSAFRMINFSGPKPSRAAHTYSSRTVAIYADPAGTEIVVPIG